MKTIFIILALVVICLLVQSFTMLPWWSFIIPCFFAGIVMGKKEWSKIPFFIGFMAGFIVWAGATIFFHARFNGNILEAVSNIMGMNRIVVFLMVGLMGGLLAGLSVLSGYMLFKKEDKEGLKIKMNA